MSPQISEQTVELVQKLDDIPRKDFKKILRPDLYSPKDVKNAADLISKMLEWIPKKRISCQEALKHPFFKDMK